MVRGHCQGPWLDSFLCDQDWLLGKFGFPTQKLCGSLALSVQWALRPGCHCCLPPPWGARLGCPWDPGCWCVLDQLVFQKSVSWHEQKFLGKPQVNPLPPVLALCLSLGLHGPLDPVLTSSTSRETRLGLHCGLLQSDLATGNHLWISWKNYNSSQGPGWVSRDGLQTLSDGAAVYCVVLHVSLVFLRSPF